MKRSTKRLLSILICLAMAVVMLPVAAFAVQMTTVYCQAPSAWTGCNAYWWGSSSENPSWPGVAMTPNDDGIWEYDIPADATGLIFNDGAGTQTSDLTVPADENVMYVFENQYWTTYGKVEVFVDYYVAGEASLCGVDWQPGAVQNRMSANADGTYSITYTGVAADVYELKVTTGSWATCWGEAGTTNNFALTVEEDDSTVVITFDPATQLISAQVNAPASAEATLIGEGTAVFEDVSDAWDAPVGLEFVPAADGVVTIVIDACDPGYYVERFDDGEWVVDYVGNAAGVIEVPVAAGVTYEFYISTGMDTQVGSDKCAGSVSYKLTANVPAGEPNQGGEKPGEGGENSEANPQPIIAFYGNYIEPGQTMWFVFDNYENMINNGVYSQMLHISADVPYAVTYRGEEVPVDAEGFVVYEMMDVIYQGKYVFSVTNNGTFKAFFTIEVKDRPEYVISEIALVLGDNVVLTDPAFDKTLYEFTPTEKGIYSFTVSDGTIGNWGNYFNPVDHTGTKDTVLQWTCTDVGQSIMIGVAGTEEAVLTVAKTVEYIEEAKVPVTVYQNTYDFSYQLPQNPDLVAIDVLDDEADVAVLDEKGFYRYGSKYGPLMVADLNEFPINLADAYLNGQLKAYVYDANGKLAARYDYNDAMNEYLEAGLVPVTEELARMLKQIGDHHSWWQANGFVFEEVAPSDEATAWMVACSWLKGSELDPNANEDNQSTNKPGSNNQSTNKPGSNQGSVPQTADISMIWAMVAMVLSGICLVVLKKKESFFLN